VTDDGDKDMTKQLFDDAIGDVPPSTVDVEAAIARGRRVVLVHRLANPVVATVAAVAVLLGAVAVVLLSSDDANGGLGPAIPSSPTTSRTAPPTTTSTSSCFDGVEPTAPPATERPAVTAHRLTQFLTNAVKARVEPGATLVVHPGAQYPDGTPRGPLEVFYVHSETKDLGHDACQMGEDYFLGWSDVRAPAGTGNIQVLVARGGGNNEMGTDCGTNNHIEACHVKRTAGGDVAVQTTYRMESGTTQFQVAATKADGTVVQLQAEDIAGSSKSGGAATATKPPLTMAQLTAIALDPRVTMYPEG
jgi:hypothetical protein